MIISNLKLQLILNYDTNEKKVLTAAERIKLHQCVSHRLGTGQLKEIDRKLSQKLKRILHDMDKDEYSPKNWRYKIDGGDLIKTSDSDEY